MAILQDILYQVKIKSVKGNLQSDVKDLQIDSRKISIGSCFIAIRGAQADGHAFIENAVQAGAASIICETLPSVQAENVIYVEVENSAEAAGIMANHYYDQPSSKLKLVGITGTNGKTTVATLLYKLFTALGYDCGLLSTVQN